jgi:hypothetical protein
MSVLHAPLLGGMNLQRVRPLLASFGEASSEGAAYRGHEVPAVAASASIAGSTAVSRCRDADLRAALRGAIVDAGSIVEDRE